MTTNPYKTADLVTFTKEILNKKRPFLHSVTKAVVRIFIHIDLYTDKTNSRSISCNVVLLNDYRSALEGIVENESMFS